MSVTERRSYKRSSFQVPALSENVLLAIIALAFLIFHIAVGVVLIKPSGGAAATTQDEPKPSPYD
ncbi:MAG TPA: hypothetical protein VKY22_05070 [Bradyrhizobium sp.]|nr:hypothetical protein [Bradyrhizobium sp.]